jgi:hypothetical protein
LYLPSYKTTLVPLMSSVDAEMLWQSIQTNSSYCILCPLWCKSCPIELQSLPLWYLKYVK